MADNTHSTSGLADRVNRYVSELADPRRRRAPYHTDYPMTAEARKKVRGQIEVDAAPQEDDEASEAAAEQRDRPHQGDLRADAAKAMVGRK